MFAPNPKPNRAETADQRPARRRLPSPALALSVVSLFVAMSGAAVALPGTSTVNSGDIKDNTVKSVDLKDGKAVTSDDVTDESLTTTDIALDTLTADDLAADSVGTSEIAANAIQNAELADNSVTAAEIAANSVGPSELAPNSVRGEELGDGIHTHTNTVVIGGGAAENGAYATDAVTATCGAGEELISGSGKWVGGTAQDGAELFLSEIDENHGNETVIVKGGNDSGANRTLVAVATCL